MGKKLIIFMLVMAFITTTMGIGYSVDFFETCENVLDPVTTVVGKVGDFLYDWMQVGVRPVPDGVFYYARWYFGEAEEYYVDLVYEFTLGIPEAYPIGSNVKIRSFSNQAYQAVYITTDKGWYHYSGEIFYDRYEIDVDIYRQNFRGKNMSRSDFYDLLEKVSIDE